jgi:hypothetical protein
LGTAGSPLSDASPFGSSISARSDARIGGVPRWRVLRLRRERGLDGVLVVGDVGAETAAVTGDDGDVAGAGGVDGAGPAAGGCEEGGAAGSAAFAVRAPLAGMT